MLQALEFKLHRKTLISFCHWPLKLYNIKKDEHKKVYFAENEWNEEKRESWNSCYDLIKGDGERDEMTNEWLNEETRKLISKLWGEKGREWKKFQNVDKNERNRQHREGEWERGRKRRYKIKWGKLEHRDRQRKRERVSECEREREREKNWERKQRENTKKVQRDKKKERSLEGKRKTEKDRESYKTAEKVNYTHRETE